MAPLSRHSRFRNFGWISLEVIVLIGLMGVRLLDQSLYKGLMEDPIFSPLAGFLILLVITNLVATVIKWLNQKRQRRRGKVNPNFFYGIDNIRKLVVGMLVVFTFFQLLGIDLKTLFTSLSIVAAAIAIISKEIVNDLLVGLYHSFSDNFEINDYVKLNNQKGKVIDIGLLKIKLLNDNDDIVVLPNGKVYAEEIINYTRRDARLLSIDFEMAIKEVRGIEALEAELINALAPFSDRIEAESYNLKIVELKKDLLILKFQYRLMEMDFELQKDIKRKTVRMVYNYITANQKNESDVQSELK